MLHRWGFWYRNNRLKRGCQRKWTWCRSSTSAFESQSQDKCSLTNNNPCISNRYQGAVGRRGFSLRHCSGEQCRSGYQIAEGSRYRSTWEVKSRTGNEESLGKERKKRRFKSAMRQKAKTKSPNAVHGTSVVYNQA